MPQPVRKPIDLDARASLQLKIAQAKAERRNERRRVRREAEAQAARAVLALCDCGELKPAAQDACDRCGFLDGRTKCEIEIISLLREHGPLTVKQLCNATKRIHRAVYSNLQRLAERGRIRSHSQAGGEHDQAHVYQLAEPR